MKPYGISAHELSRKTGIPGENLKQAINTEKPASAATALRLSRLSGAMAEQPVRLRCLEYNAWEKRRVDRIRRTVVNPIFD